MSSLPPRLASARAADSASNARRAWGWRRALPWVALLALLLVAQSLLLALTVSYEATKAQEQAEQVAAEVGTRLKHLVTRDLIAVQGLEGQGQDRPPDWAALWREHPSLLRLRWHDLQRRLLAQQVAPRTPVRSAAAPSALPPETELACATALNHGSAQLSRSYFVPWADGEGMEVSDLCLPLVQAGQPRGLLVAQLGLRPLLEAALPPELARSHELSLVEGDGTRLARAGVHRGAGVYVAERIVDLPGLSLQLRADGVSGRPQWIPNLATSLVMGLTLALLAMVVLLARDVRRRAGAESALAEALALRQAMENSLITGLRTRDNTGQITYVNPAFCAMVGFDAATLLAPLGAAQPHPPYWPPEFVDEYQRRQEERRARWQAAAPGGVQDSSSRQGFETVFMRKSGERFPVLIFESALLDAGGRQTGWLSAVLDVSEQRRVEELSRQQQERLQASARLATVGEMASLLSHELNQPLSAIASYATGSLNLLDDPAPLPDTPALLRQALERIATQAERAGKVIKSVHDFVRRREQAREPVAPELLLDAVMPLVRLQARKSGCRVELDVPPKLARLHCDRTMVEQVLLNLSRNGIQAMDGFTPAPDRVLTIRLRARTPRWIELAVLDCGPGISPDVARQLFTPFFTTRGEGMGLGLSLCRTVIEQHGGALDFENRPGGGCEFRFTLPTGAAP